MDITILLLIPVATGIILLVIEYWVIQPLARGQSNETGIPPAIKGEIEPAKIDQNEITMRDAFSKLAVGLVGGVAGITAALFIRAVADDHSKS